MVTNDARLATLALFKPSQLFTFAMKLLNLPAPARRLLCRRGRILSRIVSDDVLRVLRRQHNPEEFHLMFFGKAFELDQLAVTTFPGRPVERVHTPIGGSRAGIIHLTIVL